MKLKSFNECIFIAFVSGILSASASISVAGQQNKKEIYLATELNNVICGYSRIILSDTTINGMNVEVMKQTSFFNFFALGHDITQCQKFNYHIDPSTGNFIYHDSFHQQGENTMSSSMYVAGDTIRITTPDSDDISLTNLPEGLIIPNTQFYPYLRNDFVANKMNSKTYPLFNVRTGKVEQTTYSKTGEEQLELAGKIFDAVVLTQSDSVSGLTIKLWIDKKSGMRLKVIGPNHMSSYLADASVIGKIKTGNWDAIFFSKTNEFISDIRNISYMKVEAGLEIFPSATIEDLNFQGQAFSGKSDENRTEGVFEISHERYDGKNAPPFPFATMNKYTDLSPYLEAADMIESNDSILVALAKELTKESKNLWEATCNISDWVAINIEGSILGGTARETYDTKSGLCGSQSMLMTALCRAAGIPARSVWGCLYTPEYGGSFGHHAWNEIFMGEAGWIPVDVTIHETNFVDSGHIRLGVLNTRQTLIKSWEMEILDFRL